MRRLAALATPVLLALAVAGSLTITPPGRAYAQQQCDGSALQAQLDQAPAGGTVDVPGDCLYRVWLLIRRPVTLRRDPLHPGALPPEIRGSDVWTGWTRQGSYWRSTLQVPNFWQGDTS